MPSPHPWTSLTPSGETSGIQPSLNRAADLLQALVVGAALAALLAASGALS